MPAGTISLPPHAARVLELLEQSGFEAWCVGGCIRDSLLGLVPGDWDVASSARPEETKACFRDFRTVDTGIAHGTVTVLMEGKPVEITTFRSDGAYSDARHPDSVCFSRRLEDDLSRRDFTVNALAYHPQRGLRDPFGGLTDLEHRLLRCVGQPERRFSEDALRVLRCLRFASVLGFFIEPATLRAAQESKGLLRAVSWERIREELSKLLCGKNAAPVLRQNSGVLFSILPELAPMETCTQETKYHCFDVWEHTLHALAAAPPESVLRWAALLHDSGKPAAKCFSGDGTAHFYGHARNSESLAQAVLSRLRFSNREREAVCTLIRYHGEPLPIPEKRLKKLLGLLGRDRVFQLFALMRADLSAKEPSLYPVRVRDIGQSEALARTILDRGDCLSLKNLAVHGGDLIQLGYPQGSRLGRALDTLLDEVTSGSLPNEKRPLLERARGLLEEL